MARNHSCLLYLFALPLLLLAVIGFGLLHASALRAADNVGPSEPSAPTPTRASTPILGGAPSSATRTTPPGSQPPPYAITVPSLSGKVLHFGEESYTYSPGGQDPANGRWVRSDAWLQLAADGSLARQHAVTTYDDGTFHQENLERPGYALTVFGRDYQGIVLQCAEGGKVTGQSHRSAQPLFVDVTGLARTGFVRQDGSTPKLPITAPLPGVEPIALYGLGTASTRWIKQESFGNGSTSTSVEVVGEGGRVVYSRGTLTRQDGSIAGETIIAYGPLDVYAPATAPASVFMLSLSATSACPDGGQR